MSSARPDQTSAGDRQAERDDPPTTPDAAERPTHERWRSLLVPRLTLGHVAVALLCAGLGFAVVAQVRQTQEDVLSGMRQDDLVRLLDELTQRNADLSEEQEELRRDLAELRSSTTSREAAQEAAEIQARTRGVLAGTLPVHGPGIRVEIEDPGGGVRAQVFVTILEELRNAGVESVELSGQRLTASSWILDGPEGGLVVDGVVVESPYEWLAIGDPATLSVALDIPGGALASVRNAGGEVTVTEDEDIEITATKQLTEPEHATPVPPEEADG
ncbi:DUF881 domain-containing protein [Georgenia sp. EYE_87]|uniref:DUF881 domain-containing protein n=1 Tax=Georgenia sp. EYE_87 TaxID=2853448 RepID=UPI002003971E|nr:DUF881 domain-containing protein [Georgenia sp. EYE_87]MCK6209131.1 DUF881 domain-containing protein [Georgenia sp. EYE_87]